MAKMTTTFEDVYTAVCNFLGSDVGDAEELAKAKDIVYRAYKRFLYPTDVRTHRRHQWSFLRAYHELTTEAGTETYDVPEDFLRMIVEPTFSKSSSYGPLSKVSPEYIDNTNAVGEVSGFPTIYALKRVEDEWKIVLWPIPNGEYTINFAYIMEPDKPEDDDDEFLGGPESGEVITELALAVAEQQEDDMTTTHHTQIAETLLQSMIIGDDVQTADTLGRALIHQELLLHRNFKKVTDIYVGE